MARLRLFWDWGTAYDLLVSLEVLHDPAEFGVRGAWAAGVRARLPAAEREVLKQAQALLVCPPIHWVHGLPDPKDGATALWVLGQTPPSQRLEALFLSPETPEDVRSVLKSIAARRAWDDSDRETLQAARVRTKGEKCRYASKELIDILDAWSRADETGERYLQALRTYHESFFAEEEERIRPVLRDALTRAQDLAKRLELPELLEELTQGLRFEDLPEIAELVLVPSYWCTPLVFYEALSAERQLWLYGAKPANASLVPGQMVPDALLQALKALSDPTRLRILRYLSQEPLTPAQLSRRLRLRAPTITHHLRTLRLAGLVRLTVHELAGKEKDLYTARPEAVAAAFDALQGFLEHGDR